MRKKIITVVMSTFLICAFSVFLVGNIAHGNTSGGIIQDIIGDPEPEI